MKRDPNTDAPNFFSFARDYLHTYMSKVQGLSPKTVEAYRISLECFLDYLTGIEHITRAHVSFDHFDRPHLKAWLAWMVNERQYAPTTIALRLSAVKAFLAYSSHEDITLVAFSQATRPCGRQPAPERRSSTSPKPKREPSLPLSPVRRRNHAGTGCFSSSSMTPPPASARSPA